MELLHLLQMCGALLCAVWWRGTERGGVLQSSVLRIVLDCHLKPLRPFRFAAAYKTLLWLHWDKQRRWEKKRRGRGVETITRGARPISSIFSREHASIPKDSGSQSFYAPLPNFCSYRRRRRGDLCHGNPILPPPRVSSVCLGELKIGGERLLGLLICLQNRGGLLDWLNALVSVWASILCVCLYGTSLRRRSEPGPHLQRMRSRKDSLRGGGINWFSEISGYFTHCCLVYRDGKICE